MIKELVILAALVPLSVASPTEKPDARLTLPRPSPINPAIAGDKKPAEKITKITDPAELIKHKRELTGRSVEAEKYPTKPLVLASAAATPVQQHDNKTPLVEPAKAAVLHRQKRDETKPATTTSKTAGTGHDAHEHSHSHEKDASKTHRQQRDVSHLLNTTAAAGHDAHDHHHTYEDASTKQRQQRDVSHILTHAEQGSSTIKPQVLPARLPAPIPTGHSTKPAKRDIPVPLVAKHKHDDTNKSDSSSSEEDDKDATNPPKPAETASAHSTPAKKPTPDAVQVEDLSEPKTKQDAAATATPSLSRLAILRSVAG